MSALRAALADALAKQAAKQAAWVAAQAAASAVWRVTADARHAASAAAQALADGQAEAAEALADAIGAGVALAPARSTTALRVALAEADTRLFDAEAARDRILARAAEQPPAIAAMDVRAALDAVVAAEATAPALKLAREVERLQLELLDKAMALARLVNHGAAAGDADVRRIGWRFNTAPSNWDAPAATPARARWQAWIDALRADPHAALPRL